MNLLIPVGIPGCGKSSWPRRVFGYDISVVSSDSIRDQMFGSRKEAHEPLQKQANNIAVFAEFHNRIDTQLQHSVPTYADATNLTGPSRHKLRDIAAKYGVDTHLFLFKNPDEAFFRNTRRNGNEIVPEEVMLTMLSRYYEALREVYEEDYTSVTEIASVT